MPSWIERYAQRRYNTHNTEVSQAWATLHSVFYQHTREWGTSIRSAPTYPKLTTLNELA